MGLDPRWLELSNLPAPSVSFSIPSLYDDTTIDARLYHPSRNSWRRKGAIIAHPYAPFHGSMDDHVVHLLTNVLLASGFVVGLFNFRGAGTSKARTSWSGKAEDLDYISFVGFFVIYMDHLEPDKLPVRVSSNSVQREVENSTKEPITLILGGYSYGSLITSHLPEIGTIFTKFVNPVRGTAAHCIRRRAICLAVQRNSEVRLALAGRRGRPVTARDVWGGAPRPHSVATGGLRTSLELEDAGHIRRTMFNKESRESLDTFIRRKSMDSLRSIKSTLSNKSARKIFHYRRRDEDRDSEECLVPFGPVPRVPIPTVKTYYLLVSPLVGPASYLATSFSRISWLSRFSLTSITTKDPMYEPEDRKFAKHPTLAIFGNNDVFVSHKAILKWAKDLSSQAGSTFEYREIRWADHFWSELRGAAQLRRNVGDWVDNVVAGKLPCS
ncbi:MAG: hypothetical protein M1834_003573 [Cirrosporium novae-zelandiae]|nr:MAG: hypothetical protein M1834_003573 [Cirrosporium novae-zelandiae]